MTRRGVHTRGYFRVREPLLSEWLASEGVQSLPIMLRIEHAAGTCVVDEVRQWGDADVDALHLDPHTHAVVARAVWRLRGEHFAMCQARTLVEWEGYRLWRHAARGDVEHVRDMVELYTGNRAVLHWCAEPHRRTPLFVAALMGHAAVVRVLCEAGCGVATESENGTTPVLAACARGHSDVVQLLALARADLSARSRHGCSGLHIAAEHGHVATVRALIAAGVDVNCRDAEGATALIFACREGQVGVARVLCREGADVNATDHDGWSPVMNAASHGHAEVVEALRCVGADLEKPCSGMMTPVLVAAEHGHAAVVRVLCEAGVDLNAQDERGWTCALAAASYGHMPALRLLWRWGARLDVPDACGETALSRACMWQYRGVACFLVARGVRRDRKCAGRLPVGWAVAGKAHGWGCHSKVSEWTGALQRAEMESHLAWAAAESWARDALTMGQPE